MLLFALQALNVEAHASLNMKNKEGKTPLMIAAEHSRLDNIKLLLRLGANPNHEPHLHELFHTPEYKTGLKTIETARDISNKVGWRQQYSLLIYIYIL